MSNFTGGWGGIRTPGGVAPTTVFKTVAIDPVLLTTRSRSTVLTLVSLTRMQDRRNRPRLSPILNFFTDGLSNLRLCSLTATQRCRQNVTNARIIQYWGRVVNSSVGGKLLRLRTCGYVISLSPRREPT